MKNYLVIEFKKFGARDSGLITKTADNRYYIKVNTNDSVLEQIGTLFHELVHLVFFIFFNDKMIDEKKEHEVCTKVDAYSQKLFKHYLNKGG